MSSQSLIEMIDRYVKEENFRLPVFNKVAVKLQNLVSSDNYEISDIERIIQSDPALAGEVLKTANSPYFKGLVEIRSIKNAITRLGASQVVDIALMMSQRSSYNASDKFIQGLMNKAWQGAVACAMTSRWISDRLSFDDSSEVFMGGLLHDIGYLFLLTVIDRLTASNSIKNDFSHDLVMELLKTLHTEKGDELLKGWNLPEIYCIIAKDHHLENFDTSLTSLCIVRLADKACIKLGLSIEHDKSIQLTETREAEELGLTPIMLAEMEIMMEDAFRGISATGR